MLVQQARPSINIAAPILQAELLILDGGSEHVAQAWRKTELFPKKKKKICDFCRSKQMPYKDQITEITTYDENISELPLNISIIDVLEKHAQ